MNKLFSLKFLLLALAAAGVLSISSCEKGEESNSEKPIVSNTMKTECLSSVISSHFSPDSIIVYYNNSNRTIHVEHYNHVINCGHDSIDINVVSTNDTIWIKEIDFGEEANCTCSLNNLYQINNIEKGQQYTIIIENCSRNSLHENCNIVYNQILNS